MKRQSRRDFLKSAGRGAASAASLAALSMIGSTGCRSRGRTKPNVILILADDLGYAALGCYGQKLIRTPHLDRMAGEGLRFTDSYSANTVCVPSRVGLLTGRHPGHASVRDNFTPPLPGFTGFTDGWPADLWPPKVPTLGQVMKRAGYRTAQFGKLEAGIPMAPGKMAEHGWDTWFGFRQTDEAAQYYPLEMWRNEERVVFPENEPEDVRRSGIVGAKGVYSADLFLSEILKFIDEDKDRPFFIYYPAQVPHGRAPKFGEQIQVPDLGPYADREWTPVEKLYAAMLSRFDGHIGRILAKLKERGLDKDTVVLFTSDNGDENSYYRFTKTFGCTGPLRGKKRFLYEGGIRVPLIARWPGRIPAGQESSLPCAGWDLLATLSDLAGAAPPQGTDGISLVPALLGRPGRQESREYLYWEHHMGKQQAVRMGRWKGVRFGGTLEPIELYDLVTDVGETTNLASGHPDLVKKIDSIMAAARRDSEFTRYWPLPEHRLTHVSWDKRIFDQLEKGIDWDRH